MSFAPAVNTFITEGICAGDNFSIIVGGTIFDETNPTGVELLTSSTGCDSIVTVDLTFFPASNAGSETFVGCEGDGFSVIVGGTLYNESNPIGTEVLVGADVNGCDSTVNVNLIFMTVPVGQENFITCDLSTPPTVTEVIANGAANGCDSIVVFTTIFLPNDETEIMLSSCDPDEVGVEIVVLTNTSGCDSTITTTTTLLTSDQTDIMAGSCDPDDVGVETIVLTNSFGCDSTITTTTTLLPSDQTDIMAGSCDPNDVGVETIVLTNSFGCDSTITTTTTLLPSDVTNITQGACNPIDTGTVVLNLVNMFGCDSTVTIVTEFEPLDNSVTVLDGTITASLPDGNYQWIDCDNNNASIAGETGQSFTPSVSGNYAVMIALIGCTTVTSECSNITVVATEEVWFSNQLEVMPNPTNGEIRLGFGVLENVNVRIMDLTGRILLERNNLNGGFEDFLIEGAAGLYFVGVEVDGVTGWMRVVKN